MKDPYLPQILGLVAVGMTCTALSISGYLHQQETVRFLGTQLEYQAAYRKIPLSMVGAGLCISAWVLMQSRREYRQQYQQWERQMLLQQSQTQLLDHKAYLEGYQQVAKLQAAERLYPAMAPYMDAEYQEVPAQPQPGPVAPGQVPVTPTSETVAQSAPTDDPTAYLQNFLEYPGLLFGGMGAGKSWTARYLVMQKVRAGHQVVVLDPHAASHEWQGVRHIGAGMNYRAIAAFLDWYLKEIETR